jgi:hypothetical protein
LRSFFVPNSKITMPSTIRSCQILMPMVNPRSNVGSGDHYTPLMEL